MIEWAQCAFDAMVYVYRVFAYQKGDYYCVKSNRSCKRNEYKIVYIKERIKSCYIFYFYICIRTHSHNMLVSTASVTMVITNYGISA